MRSKIRNIAILYFIVALTTQCSSVLTNSYTNKQNNQTMEILNIDKLFKQETKETSDSIIKVDYYPSINQRESVIYYEEDKKTGEIITIKGDRIQGFRKAVKHKDSPIQENLEFFPNGNLRSKSSNYIGFLKKGDDQQIMIRPAFSFDIGKSYVFDDSGAIISEKNADEGFTILFADLEKILAKEGIDINQQAFNVMRKTKLQVSDNLKFANKDGSNDDYYWQVDYKKNSENEKFIIVGGTTGEIIQKGNIISADH